MHARSLMLSSLSGISVAAVLALSSSAPATGQDAKAELSIKDRKFQSAPWSPADLAKRRQEVGFLGPGSSKPYPKPTFPRKLAKPNSLEELMPNARAAVRQTGGRTPLGLTKTGDVVVFVAPFNAEPMVQEGIIAAYKERGIEARVLFQYDLLKVAKADLEAIAKTENVFDATDSQQEFREWFFRSIYDVDKARQWFKQQDAALYNVTFPELKYPDERLKQLSKDTEKAATRALIAYLDANPTVNKVFWGRGGRTRTRKLLQQHGSKYVGNYTYVNFFDLMSEVPSFPGDVWRLVETKTIEPLAFVDRVEMSDPEGSALTFDVSPQMADAWSKGVYQQGHLFMFPAQATGIWPYSLVNYPAFENTYLPGIHVTTANGYIAATNDHISTHPRMELKIKDGKLAGISGGGYYGDLMKIGQNYPGINDKAYPEYDKNEPGYWYLFEAGLGTNPKYFKHPGELLEGGNHSERNVGGTIHWSFGTYAQHGPEKIGEMSPARIQFGKDTNLPIDHCCHNHTLMATYQVRVRGLDQWVTLVEHGRITANDDKYVRALASRYGDPDKILSKVHVPPLPGINAPGNYNDYARDPGDYWINWSKAITAGTSPWLSE